MSLSKQIISKIIKNAKEFREEILRLPYIAKKDNWRISYDKMTDALYFTPKNMPRDTILYNVNRELSLFVTPSLCIKGLFIENYSANFLKHNSDFEELLNILSKKENDDTYITNNKKRAKLYERALEQTLLEAINDKNSLLSGAKSLGM